MKKIIFEREKCIGCGSCASLCPSFWELSNDGKATLKESAEKEDNFFIKEVESVECNTNASENCPVQCIKVEE